jgi:hypothetical protein
MKELREDYSQFGVTVDLFNEWRSPRFGEHNPTLFTNAVWRWLISTKHSAYIATEMIGLPTSEDGEFDEPCWCFDRFGQSCTILPDGRKVYIAGEHEDHYDPNFYIYNDVVIEDLDGSIAIYGYPEEEFPPTDFHSATLVGSEIIIIGNLGYDEERKQGFTQVLYLNICSFSIRERVTSGHMPGWIHKHQAVLSNDGQSILVTGGKIDREGDRFLVENIDDWRLILKSGIWERLSNRNWSRRVISRSSGKINYLWHIRQALWSLEVGWEADYEKAMIHLEEKLGKAPDVKAVTELYNPNMAHDILPEREDEYNVYRIQIEGTTVRYVEKDNCVQITIEGELPELTIHQLVKDLRIKLMALENIDYHATKLA